MCGIVGYISENFKEDRLIKLLKMLEYRGYDSAGIGTVENDKIKLKKVSGNIGKLENLINDSSKSKIGIAHTRWATHGNPTIENSHPHISNNNEWAVVHNGIIENFGEIKKDLMKLGYKFISNTDTEVIPNLLERYDSEDKIQTIINVCEKLIGSFGLAIINKDSPDKLFLAKRKSPLYISVSDGEIITASDPICFLNKEGYYEIDDNEFCEAKLGSVIFYNKNKEIIKKKIVKIENMKNDIKLNNFKHFMQKEIYETPKVLKNIVKVYGENLIFEKLDKKLLSNLENVLFIGCGTAYHAAMMGVLFCEQIANVKAECYIASEFIYRKVIIKENTLVVFISQSGETADTLLAHEIVQKMGIKTIAITNVLYSTLAKKADFVIPTCAGREIAVASTKAYVAQITILNMFTKFLKCIKQCLKIEYITNIKELSNNFQFENFKLLEKISSELTEKDTVIFIGRGMDYITSEEASLKLKEVTYINSQAHPAGELKHGFLALITEGTYVFVIATQKELFKKTLNNVHEAASRGAKIILFTPFDVPAENLKDIYCLVGLQLFDSDIMPISSIVPFQLLSYYVSIKKGLNPDKPRNLAKSVTVE